MPIDKSKTFILKSGKCSWGNCIYCGYGKIEGFEPTAENVNRDLDGFFKIVDETTEQIKIFGSGSFLDEKQFPIASRKYLVDLCKKHSIKQLLFESRPEFITDETLKPFKDQDYTVAIGLEIADNKTLKDIKKGFTVEQYEKAAKTIHKNNGKVRTYLLINLPYVKDIQKSLDTSVEFALNYSDSIVLINLYPHSSAKMIDLYLDLKWRPLDRNQFKKVTGKWKTNKKIEIDFETFAFTPRIPEQMKCELEGADEKNLNHPHYEIWQDYFTRFYTPPKVKDTILFLPCAFRKPYSLSKTHKEILKRIQNLHFYARIHQVMISNPGVIPREFESKYPFAHYDWPEWEETEDLKKQYTKVTQRRIEDYLKAHRYKKYMCYFKQESESYIALKNACKKLDIELIQLFDKTLYKDNMPETNVLVKRRALDAMVTRLKKEMKR
ncbi:MAG: radical SAM protein [Nanohaloarchaea archaeon]|nr:radical SAM protein [Candidatus Nanohaloarchaea archaeon]